MSKPSRKRRSVARTTPKQKVQSVTLAQQAVDDDFYSDDNDYELSKPVSTMPEQKTTQKPASSIKTHAAPPMANSTTPPKERKKYTKKKKIVTFQIDEQDLLALIELAKKQDRSISSCIRMLIKSAVANDSRNSRYG